MRSIITRARLSGRVGLPASARSAGTRADGASKRAGDALRNRMSRTVDGAVPVADGITSQNGKRDHTRKPATGGSPRAAATSGAPVVLRDPLRRRARAAATRRGRCRSRSASPASMMTSRENGDTGTGPTISAAAVVAARARHSRTTSRARVARQRQHHRPRRRPRRPARRAPGRLRRCAAGPPTRRRRATSHSHGSTMNTASP